MPRAFDSDRRWDFDVPAEQLWDRIVAVDEYDSWWPWLRRFDPGPGVQPGAQWRCEVAPPLPYVVRFTVSFDRIVEHRSIETTVDGDVRGRARLLIDSRGDRGSRARLVSSLAPAQPVLRAVGLAARPLVEWGHDWVLDQGRHQFVTRAWNDA